MNITTASSSRLVTQYLRSGLDRSRLAYAITRSVPSSCCWERTAPIPVSLASVSRINGLEQSGNASIGAETNFCLRFSKDVWQSSVHLKLAYFSVR